MRKILLISTLFILLGVGCIKNNDTVPNDSLFLKKKECGNLIKEIEDRIDKNYNSGDRTAWLDIIFYSPERDSCLYVKETWASLSNGGLIYLYDLYDAFTNENIVSTRGCVPEDSCGKTPTDAREEFDNQIEKYKLMSN